MDVLTCVDRLRALVTTVWCCIPSSRRVQLNDEDHLPDPSTSTFGHSPRGWVAATAGWDGRASRGTMEQEDDAWSLHSGVGNGSTRNGSGGRRHNRRGGDVSGGGGDEGSGLTRWTLFRSWWRGEGRIRLSESEGEEEGSEEPERVDDAGGAELDRSTSRFTLDGEDEEAERLERQSRNSSPTTPFSPFLPLSSPSPSFLHAEEAAETPHSPVFSEGTTLVDTPTARTSSSTLKKCPDETKEERKARRTARRARRRAKELGISVEEFLSGASGEPEELPNSPYLDVQPAVGRKSGRSAGSSRSLTSSGSRRSRDVRRDLEEVPEEEPLDGVEEGYLEEPHRQSQSKKNRRDGSSSSSRSHGRSRHRSHPSVSTSTTTTTFDTLSTESSSHRSDRSHRFSRRHKHRSLSPSQELVSPLHEEVSPDYQNEASELVALQALDHMAGGTEEGRYRHIGVLPSASAGDVAE
ncbi:hypothetical protein JCM11641_005914 [Rhodosporidiobolus odoratus]